MPALKAAEANRVPWELLRTLEDRFEEVTANFSHDNALLPLAGDETAQLASNFLAMSEFTDIIKRRYPGEKVRLDICLRLRVG